MKVLTFTEWKQLKPDQTVLAEVQGLIDSGHAHWFEFAADDKGQAVMRMTEVGRREYEFLHTPVAPRGNA